MVLWTKRRIGLGVLVAFVVALIVLLQIPPNAYYSPKPVQIAVDESVKGSLQTYPAYDYTAYLQFKSNGSFSVNNPIRVKVKITYANISLLSAGYCCISLDNAVDSPPKFATNGASLADRIQLTAYSNGTYSGEGSVLFQEAGNSSTGLLPLADPNNPTPIESMPHGASVLTISGSADTLSIDLNRNAIRWGVMIGVLFGIILFQPVLEAILLPENSPQPLAQTQTPPIASQPQTQSQQPTKLTRKQRKELGKQIAAEMRNQESREREQQERESEESGS